MKLKNQTYGKFTSCAKLKVDFWGISNLKRKKKFRKRKKRSLLKFKFGKKNFVLQMLSIRIFKAYYNPNMPTIKIKKRLNYKNNTFKRFLHSLECRLDTIIYRSCLSYTLVSSKSLIKHNNIVVNNKLINNYNYKAKLFDLVEVVSLSKINVNNNIFKVAINKYYPLAIPRYIEVDFQMLTFYMVQLPKISNITFSENIPLKLTHYKLLKK